MRLERRRTKLSEDVEHGGNGATPACSREAPVIGNPIMSLEAIESSSRRDSEKAPHENVEDHPIEHRDWIGLAAGIGGESLECELRFGSQRLLTRLDYGRRDGRPQSAGDITMPLGAQKPHEAAGYETVERCGRHKKVFIVAFQKLRRPLEADNSNCRVNEVPEFEDRSVLSRLLQIKLRI